MYIFNIRELKTVVLTMFNVTIKTGIQKRTSVIGSSSQLKSTWSEKKARWFDKAQFDKSIDGRT